MSSRLVLALLALIAPFSSGWAAVPARGLRPISTGRALRLPALKAAGPSSLAVASSRWPAASRAAAAMPALPVAAAPAGLANEDALKARAGEAFDLNAVVERAASAPEASPIELGRELELSGLSARQLELISGHSRNGRPLAFDEFLRTTPLEENGYLLGLTHPVYAGTERATGLTNYREAYVDMFSKVRVDVGAEFMDRLASDPSPMVFLVPRQALNHPEGKMTQEELEWLLAHPAKMANVHFVFGAYDWPGAKAALAERRRRFPLPADRTRLEQRRRLSGRAARELQGEGRRAGVEEFVRGMASAEHVRERPGSGLTYGVDSSGRYYMMRRIERGVILTLPGDRELFISREETELQRRLAILF